MKRLISLMAILVLVSFPLPTFADSALWTGHAQRYSDVLDVDVQNDSGAKAVVSLVVHDTGLSTTLRLRFCQEDCTTYVKEIDPGEYALTTGHVATLQTNVNGFGEIYARFSGQAGPSVVGFNEGPLTRTASTLVSDDPNGSISTGILHFSSYFGAWTAYNSGHRINNAFNVTFNVLF